MEAPTTPTPNGHHLPPISNAGPRRPAPSGRTSFPPFPRRPSESDRQRSTQTPTRRQTVRPARPPPASQGRPPAARGPSAPRTHGQGDPRPTNGPSSGWADEPLKALPRKQGAPTPAPDTGTRHTTNWAHTPRGSPPRLQRSQTARARGTRRDSGGTTRAAQERTKKGHRPAALRIRVAHRPPPRPVRCPSNGSPQRQMCLRDDLAQIQGTPPQMAPHRTRTGRPCPPTPQTTPTEEHGPL